MKENKYIIKQSKIGSTNDLPKHFLGDSLEEAEKTYNEFYDTLNKISNKYFNLTRVDKSDLFSVALFALAQAKIDFNEKISSDFTTYALFIIKDALHEYIRKNSNIVITPSYIKKAAHLLDKIRNIIGNEIIAIEIINSGVINNEKLSKEVEIECEQQLRYLRSLTDRVNIPYSELLNRVELIPKECLIDENHYQGEDNVFEKILVNQILDLLTDTEKAIAKGIMEGRSYSEIAKELGKSKSWIFKQVNTLKNKVITITNC